MWNSRTILAAASAIALLAMAQPSRAADPTGIWFTDDNDARVRIYNCGQALCGTILSLREPNDPATGKPKLDKFNQDPGKRARPVVGIELMSGLKPNGKPEQWEGSLYNPEDGNTYKGILTVKDPLNLELQGCVLGGLICKSEMWKRTN
ncbi:MAG TPA: DUF2147 domain-containing protein [Xanthobacteraceae bacterium]|nr:DUF2147 domain-containing protein [Xanthobacteraceae bacterium]